MNWMCVLVGRSCTGKTSLVRMLASLLGVSLVEFSVNNSTDTSDLLGGFEKVKHNKSLLITTYDLIKLRYLNMLTINSSVSTPNDLSALTRAYFMFLFDSRRLFEVSKFDAVNELDENRDVADQALGLFKRNYEILISFKVDGRKFFILIKYPKIYFNQEKLYKV